MKQAPYLWKVYDLHKSITTTHAEIDGEWVPARALGFNSLRSRLYLAWGVFVGRYDALKWPKGQ